MYFLGTAAFLFTFIKNQEAVENFKNAHQFSYFCSFQPYHLKTDSNWCDSLFKKPKMLLRSLDPKHLGQQQHAGHW
jgi:hypothetical protein